jgi:hypothetical protein
MPGIPSSDIRTPRQPAFLAEHPPQPPTLQPVGGTKPIRSAGPASRGCSGAVAGGVIWIDPAPHADHRLMLPGLRWCRVDQRSQRGGQPGRQTGIDPCGFGDQRVAQNAEGPPELGGVERPD